MFWIILLTTLIDLQCHAEKDERSPTHFKLGKEFFPETDRDAFLPGAERNQSQRSPQENGGKQQYEGVTTILTSASNKRSRRSTPQQTHKGAVAFGVDGLGKLSANLRIIQVTKPNFRQVSEGIAAHNYRTELGFWFDTLRTQAHLTAQMLRNKHPVSRRQIDVSSFFSSLGEACEKGFEVAKSGSELLEQMKEERETKEKQEMRRSSPTSTPNPSPLQLLLQRYPELIEINEPSHPANDACIAQQKLGSTEAPKSIAQHLAKIDHYKAVFMCDISRKLDEIALMLTRFGSSNLLNLTNAFSYIEKNSAGAAIVLLTVRVKGISKLSKATRRNSKGQEALFDGAGKLCGAEMDFVGGLLQMISDKSEETEDKGGEKSGTGDMSDMLGLFGMMR